MHYCIQKHTPKQFSAQFGKLPATQTSYSHIDIYAPQFNLQRSSFDHGSLETSVRRTSYHAHDTAAGLDVSRHDAWAKVRHIDHSTGIDWHANLPVAFRIMEPLCLFGEAVNAWDCSSESCFQLANAPFPPPMQLGFSSCTRQDKTSCPALQSATEVAEQLALP